VTTSIPSVNFIPRMIFGNWLWPLRRRQLFSAASASLKAMASAVLLERHCRITSAFDSRSRSAVFGLREGLLPHPLRVDFDY
jgi:hypothetical protein